MPAFLRRQRVVFLTDVNKDSFGRPLSGAHRIIHLDGLGEQKWARKGDAGVVTSWSKGGWLKVRLDRHGCVVTVRAGSALRRESDTGKVTPPLWSRKALDEATETVNALGRIMLNLNGMRFHVRRALNERKPADVEVIETMRLELEEAARMLLKLSFSVPTQISPIPKSFGALQSRTNTPSPVSVENDDDEDVVISLGCPMHGGHLQADIRPQMDQLFG
jgi:hypothetical protein